MSASASITFTAYADATTNITSDVLFPASGDWGIDGNGAEDRIASTGFLEFDVRNYGADEGKYLFGHSACMAGWKKGTPIEMSFVFDGETRIHRRYVDSTEATGARKERVHVICVDWMDRAANYSVVNPDLLTSATGDEGIQELLDTITIPPQSTDLDVGSITHPRLLDTSSRFSSAYSEISKITDSELGYTYTEQPEILRFENMMSRVGSQALSQIPIFSTTAGVLQDENSATLQDENSADIYMSDGETIDVDLLDITRWEDENGKNVINTFKSSVHPRRVDTVPVVLYESEPIFIGSGETKTDRVFWTDETSRRAINAIPPIQDNYTKALLHFEASTIGTQQRFFDETGRYWTCNDVEAVNDVFGTSPKFGDMCAYFDGSTSYLTAADSPDWDFGTSDFTIDWWEYRFDNNAGWASMSRDATVTYPAFQLGRSDGANLLVDMSSNGTSNDIASGKTMGTITTGQFVHLAVVRSGNTFYTFKNGVQQDTWTSSASLVASSSVLYVARHGSNYMDGTIDELRISKGVARWTANFTPPTAAYALEGTFIRGFANIDGTGTEFTDSLVLTPDYGTEGATFTTENNSATSGYLFVRTLGYGIYLDSPLEDKQIDQASIDTRGDQQARLDLPYHEEKYYGILEGQRIIEQEKDSRTVLNKIYMHANKSNTGMMRFLYSDVGKLAHITVDDKIEKDIYAHIQRVGFFIKNEKDIDYWWLIKEHYGFASGLSELAVEFRGGANTDCVTFPYMPYVCDDSVTSFTTSAWLYLDTEPTSNSYFVGGAYMDGAGSMLLIGTTDRKVVFYTSRFSTSPGQWSSPADPFALTTWAHLILKWNISTSGTPTVKVNNSSVTMTQDTAPAGTLMSAKGASLFIGNAKTPALNYTRCFDGKIRDFRYYPFITTDAQDALIYNGGTPSPTAGTDGLVFQAFGVHDARYAAYNNLTLTSATRLIDGQLGIVGTPNGSPIARYV